MFGRQTNIPRSMIAAMAIVLFVQSACTVREVAAKAKVKFMCHYNCLSDEELCKAAKDINANAIIKVGTSGIESFLQTAARHGLDVIAKERNYSEPYKTLITQLALFFGM